MEMTSTVAGASVQGGDSRPPFGFTLLLVYDHGMPPNNRQQTAFSLADWRLFTHAVPELTENSFHVTSDGRVFLHDSGSLRTRLWDPRSGRSLALPDTEHALPASWKCYMSDAPTTASCIASCIVLVLYMAEPKFLYCMLGSLDLLVTDRVGFSIL